MVALLRMEVVAGDDKSDGDDSVGRMSILTQFGVSWSTALDAAVEEMSAFLS